MALLNWGVVNGGGAFESLMHALVFAEDPTAILFGRPGKDSGQDARSKDGVTVYQAKYYTGMDMACAVKVALAELKKIKKYKRLQIVLENDEAEPFGVIGITKTYSIGNLAK